MKENKCFLSLAEDISEKYKLSKYNLYISAETKLVYNTVTTAAVVFDEKVVGANLLADLLELGIVVETETDELELLKKEYEFRDALTDSFHLIIALTLDCQFRCRYCYETHPCIYMEEETMDALAALVEEKAKSGKNISVVWYGGEPLMHFSALEELTERFQRICLEYQVGYYAGMITNGYYFDDMNISRVDALGIKNIQITLDGMKEIHEKRRPIIGNKPSFERIFNNIVRLNRETDATVRLRINVDKENMDNAYELVDYCAQYNLQQMDLTLGMLKEFGCDHKCSDCDEKLYSTEEFAEEFLRFRAYAGRRGFHTAYEKMQPEYKVNACTMDSPNAYVIDPDGECYKCISQVGKKEYSIGNVRDVFDEHAHTKISPFEKEECVDCTYFPICKGGCLNSKRVANKQKCEVWKYITERLIAMDYNGGNNDGRESERDISRA